jgi:hypothetical protein
MRSKSKKKRPAFDELYVLRLDSSGRPRGARFAKLKDAVAHAAVDMKCRVFLHESTSVSRVGMELPVGRLFHGKLVMPRIRRGLYDKMVETARIADERQKIRMEAAAAKQSAYTKRLADEAKAALAEGRKMRRVRR